MQRQRIVYSGLLTVFLVATSIAFASTPQSRVDGLRQSVLALDSAWNRAIKDLQDKKNSGILEASAKKDYTKFITYLSGRIDHYCTLLRAEGGKQAVENLPCADSSSADSNLVPPSSPTKTEQVAELDQTLSQALGEFDEQLLKEEQRIAARTPAERESGGRYGGGRGGYGSSGQYGAGQSGGSAGQTGIKGSMPGQGTSQNSTTGSQSGQTSTAPSYGTGAGTGTGSREQREDNRTGTREITSGYDDIVARQLREAAEKETDPELKEKLWEEYRKYKEGIN